MAAKKLSGFLRLGVTADDVADVSAEVTAMTIKADVDEIDVPATLGAPKSSRAGGVKYTLSISYFSDGSPDTVFDLLWTAITTTADKVLFFEGAASDDPISADNPLFTGSVVVLGTQIGGTAEELMTADTDLPMTGAPDKLTVESS